MQKEINPLEFSNNLIDTYRRYLFSATPISADEPELRDEFWRQIDEFRFFDGPYIQYQPTYKRSIRFAELFDRNDSLSLDPKLKSCFNLEDLNSDEFRLYEHQKESLIKAKEGENVLIATGTGSGKTECFLLPILDDAIKNPGPGIRSIIIYPMNALANDQLDRLSHMLQHFTENEVTFGRYTGETPWDQDEAKKKYPNQSHVPCERVTRQDIRENPPHILLTNFAMLEYLLIRPMDIDIFAHNRLKYIVLDEAHTYRGAQGIEVALLMRRIQETFRGSNFNFFLTSATFASDESSDVQNELAQFASNLTGAPFKADNVLFGEAENPFLKTNTKSIINEKGLISSLPNEKSLQKWISATQNPDDLKTLLNEAGWVKEKELKNKEPIHQILYKLFINSDIAKTLHSKISQEPSTISDIAAAVFKNSSDLNLRAVQWLLIMGSHAKSSLSSAPLLGTRMHIFFRGLSGACVCLAPDCPGKESHLNTRWSFFSLNPLKVCPECNAKVLPIEVCWHCGLPVLPVYINNNRWNALSPVIADPQKRMLTWWAGTENDEIIDNDDNEEESKDTRTAYLCGCGFYSEEKLEACECGKKLSVLKIIKTKEEEIIKCPRCGGESGFFEGVTRSFITADDAPTAVLADSALRIIPGLENFDDRPAGGKRLLAFSDSRQRAAFFAPYLKRTTCESSYQKPILDAINDVITNNDGVGSFDEVAEKFISNSKKYSYIVTWDNTGYENETYKLTPSRRAGHSVKQQLKTNCLISLYRHFCNSPRQRNKLLGLGLCSIFVEFLPDEKQLLRERIPELCPENDKYLSAIQLLLNIFLARKAVRFVGQVQSQHISRVILNAAFHRTQSSSSMTNKIYRFNPYRAATPFSRRMAVMRSYQLKLLCKWLGLESEKDDETLCGILDTIWDLLFDEKYPEDSILIDSGSGNRKLNGDRILLEVPSHWFHCQSCGYLVPPSMNFLNHCPSPDCNGKLLKINKSDLDNLFKNNHLRWRYQAEPMPFEVREHTAQLQLRSSQKYQEEFKKGYINVLSCSTTFEMGVDVGALKVALLRNIPPAPANYIQRAGRVGRRNDGVSYVITFSRKLPHDQFYFCNPKRIIGGEVSTPNICLENDVLAQRHVNSYLIGAYMKEDTLFKFGDRILLQDFFLTPDAENSAASIFVKWMKEKKTVLINALERIIPSQSNLIAKTAFKNAFNTLYSDDQNCVFHHEVMLTLADYDRQIQELKMQIEKAGDNNRLIALIYSYVDKIDRYKTRFKEQRLIDFLSKTGWLPGYAFPQDVVELRVLHADYSEKMNLARDREIGISEYAPGSEIIADAKVFKSKGVIGRKESPEAMLFEPKKYMTCNECRIIHQFALNESPGSRKCVCGRNFSKPRTYIIPEGFSTSILDTPEDPRFRKIKPSPNSELFLVEGAAYDEFESYPKIKGIHYAFKKGATLFRANMGFKKNRYRICLKCGSVIESGAGRNHKTLWGNECSAGVTQIRPVDLANEFKTDVLQIRFSELSYPPPHIFDKTFWISFLSSFLTGVSRFLNIDQRDLAGTYNRIPETDQAAELIIYDKIPGGAGYLLRIKENLKGCLEAAYNVVKYCNDPACTDIESSCYTCLRSFNNQFNWEYLQRRPVIEWLERIFNI